MSDNRSIGILDSELGGLTIVRELARLMPAERILFYADTSHGPCGTRTVEAIRANTARGIRFFADADIKMLIVGCNAIAAAVLDEIRDAMPEIPVINAVLPGARAAVLRTAEHKIGVIAAPVTVENGIYPRVISSIDTGIKVYEKATPLLRALIDEGAFNNNATRFIAQYYLYELIDIGIDCLVLGSTLYAPLMEAVQSTVSTRIEIIESSLWAAKEAQDILTALNATADSQSDPTGLQQSRFILTEQFRNHDVIASALLGSALPRMEIAGTDFLPAKKG